MSSISLFKKISLFNFYKKIIKNNKLELANYLNIRIDNADRLYTVLNIPKELIGEEYSLKKSDIDRISESYIKEFIVITSNFLASKGLNELYSIYDVKKVDKYSYLVIIGFSLFKSNEFYNNLYYKFTPALVILGIITYFLLN